jgi:site-specific DNA-methyltransferase (adenine-specific)
MPERAYMLRSQTTDWATPKDFMDRIWAEFKPDLDPCGQRELHYSAWLIEKNGGRFMDGSTEAMDGLKQPWHCRCAYVNPPYGEPEHPCRSKCKKKRCVSRGHHITEYISGQPDWIEKAVREVECGNAGMVVALLPARTDTRWWQQYVMTSVKRISLDNLSCALRGAFVDRATMTAEQVRFLPGRLKFGGAKNSAPFPSAIVVWGAATQEEES